MRSILKCPETMFCDLEQILEARPELLSAGDWHQLMNGREAFTSEQITDPDTKHCLFGWVIALTPRAAEFEKCRPDVEVFANEILVNSGRKPLPTALQYEDEESMMKIIRRRAEQERTEAMLKLKDYHLN